MSTSLKQPEEITLKIQDSHQYKAIIPTNHTHKNRPNTQHGTSQDTEKPMIKLSKNPHPLKTQENTQTNMKDNKSEEVNLNNHQDIVKQNQTPTSTGGEVAPLYTSIRNQKPTMEKPKTNELPDRYNNDQIEASINIVGEMIEEIPQEIQKEEQTENLKILEYRYQPQRDNNTPPEFYMSLKQF